MKHLDKMDQSSNCILFYQKQFFISLFSLSIYFIDSFYFNLFALFSFRLSAFSIKYLFIWNKLWIIYKILIM